MATVCGGCVTGSGMRIGTRGRGTAEYHEGEKQEGSADHTRNLEHRKIPPLTSWLIIDKTINRTNVINQ